MANQWAKILNKNAEKLEKIARSAYVATGEMVVVRSPVDTGRFRANWLYGLNKINSATTTRTEFVTAPSPNNFKLGDSLFFTNSLPYAIPLEFGSSAQAPQGMVRISAAQWFLTVDKIARAMRDK